MAASAANTKSYYVGPGDGWVEIVDASTTNLIFLRISAEIHTHPFFVYAGSSAPAATVNGVKVCHHPFKVANYSATPNGSKFWVRVQNPVSGSRNNDGKLRLDVYADGGVLQ